MLPVSPENPSAVASGSWSPGPRTGRPPPEGVNVDYAPEVDTLAVEARRVRIEHALAPRHEVEVVTEAAQERLGKAWQCALTVPGSSARPGRRTTPARVASEPVGAGAIPMIRPSATSTTRARSKRPSTRMRSGTSRVIVTLCLCSSLGSDPSEPTAPRSRARLVSHRGQRDGWRARRDTGAHLTVGARRAQRGGRGRTAGRRGSRRGLPRSWLDGHGRRETAPRDDAGRHAETPGG